MLAMLSAVSWISSVLVRVSMVTLPRGRQQRLAGRGSTGATLRLDQRGDVLGLGVVDLQVLGAQWRQVLDVLLGGQRGLLAVGQLFGRADDDHVVLHALVEALAAAAPGRAPGPRARGRTRSVTLPVTESVTKMFLPLVSAISCSSVRVSMSWKLALMRSPVYTGLLVDLAPWPRGAAAARSRTGRRPGRPAARNRPRR